jgi:hypothetical protein
LLAGILDWGSTTYGRIFIFGHSYHHRVVTRREIAFALFFFSCSLVLFWGVFCFVLSHLGRAGAKHSLFWFFFLSIDFRTPLLVCFILGLFF